MLLRMLLNETPGTFTNAVRNSPRTVKRATGVGYYDELGDVLEPAEIAKVEAVTNELLRQKHQSLMERSVRPMFSKLDKSIEPRLPAILERSVVIANHAL